MAAAGSASGDPPLSSPLLAEMLSNERAGQRHMEISLYEISEATDEGDDGGANSDASASSSRQSDGIATIAIGVASALLLSSTIEFIVERLRKFPLFLR